MSRSAQCFVATWNNALTAFCSMLPHPHPRASGWRVHRYVTLPDFQGVGIGHAVMELICAAYRTTKQRHCIFGVVASVGDEPLRAFAQVAHARTTDVQCDVIGIPGMNATAALRRLTARFEYIGPLLDVEDAQRLLSK